MVKKSRWLLLVLYLVAFAWLLVHLTHGHTVALLQPQGTIAHQQRNLLAFAFFLSLIVIIPVYILTIFIAWKYKATNTKSAYTPEWDHSRRLETIWWGIPCIIILILSIVTWNSSHSLDPYRPIASTKKALTVQVVALDWKWLFIYPAQGIATVNYIKIPVGTPVDFAITSDAPMNSFWIPQLAGQVYAMSGMETHLHIVASSAGSYDGSSANISGRGFAGMNFKTVAVNDQQFSAWIKQEKGVKLALTQVSYAKLSQPSSNVPVQNYGSIDHKLYDTIVMKYMMPTAPDTEGNTQAYDTQTGDSY